MADPRSIETTARLPARSKVSRPASQPSTRGRLRVSRGSKPLHTSNHRAVSRTDRDTQPTATVSGGCGCSGPLGMRPKVDLRPNSPVKPAGMRMEPPPSPPLAMGSKAAGHRGGRAPEEPPGVRSRFHGLPVVPCSLVLVQLMPPNSEAVVCPASTAPAARSRIDLGGVVVGDPVLEDQRRLGVRPALHRLELLDAHGHPAEGQRDVGRGRRGPGGLGVQVAERIQVRGLDGGQGCVERLGGTEGPGPEGVDQGAGVFEPGLVGHGSLTLIPMASASRSAPPGVAWRGDER